jgi:hypothetical protein
MFFPAGVSRHKNNYAFTCIYTYIKYYCLRRFSLMFSGLMYKTMLCEVF